MAKQVFGLLTLTMLGTVFGPTAYGEGCDPVVEGSYAQKELLGGAVYSGCTTTGWPSTAQNTLAIVYNPVSSIIYPVIDLPRAFTPDAARLVKKVIVEHHGYKLVDADDIVLG